MSSVKEPKTIAELIGFIATTQPEILRELEAMERGYVQLLLHFSKVRETAIRELAAMYRPDLMDDIMEYMPMGYMEQKK